MKNQVLISVLIRDYILLMAYIFVEWYSENTVVG